MELVADASILIHLSAIGRFYLLRELFKGISIPEGVYTEVVIEGWGLSGSLETSEAIRTEFMKVNQVMDKEKVKKIAQEYKTSTSNAEVIQLAKELNADLVLANEEEVRTAAEASGFKVKGCLGILIEAVKSKIISNQHAIQDVDNLVKSGYRIKDEIIKMVKKTLSRWNE
jgi:predicted nucleic acid-binding protein